MPHLYDELRMIKNHWSAAVCGWDGCEIQSGFVFCSVERSQARQGPGSRELMGPRAAGLGEQNPSSQQESHYFSMEKHKIPLCRDGTWGRWGGAASIQYGNFQQY